jgi:Skp family chaperone for outer membrane proteins
MKFIKRLLPYVFTLLVLASSFYAAYRIRDILDWWKLRSYVPNESIRLLASNSGMNNLGTKLFYVHDPELLDKTQFRSSCTVGEFTIVLGCYLTNQKIYVFDVSDERLAGVEEVTAAHEMLHAAYDRLSPQEKMRVELMLTDAFDRVTDERIRENVASYRNKDPSVVPNELHSILGTEVRDLPTELENYYKKYFSNRLAVVEKAEKYSAEFQAREDKISAYDVQLSELNGEITRKQAELSDQNRELARKRSEIEALRSDVDAFNQAVAAFNRSVNAYNNSVAEVKTLVSSYNEIVVARNEIAFEERELVEAIDTRAESL